MPDVQDAASSAAPVAEPSFEVPRSGPEYTEWRKTGELPKKTEPVKPADTAAADTSKEALSGADEAELAPDTDRATTQEEPRIPKSRLDKEIAKRRELEARLARLETQAPTPTQAEPSPAKPAAPQNYAEYRKNFKPTEWVTKYGQENPDASYEDAQAAMADHLADARDYFRNIETRVNTERQALESKLGEARNRYENFDSIKSSFLSKVVSPQGAPLIPLEVLGLINDSDVLPDLIYVLAEDPASFDEFVQTAKTNRNKAIRIVTRMEGMIQEQVSKGSSARNDKGQFAKTEPPAPAKRGPESAPEPPIEIGSRGSGPLDESERALKDAERGSSKAFRQWKEAEDRKELARRRGA